MFVTGKNCLAKHAWTWGLSPTLSGTAQRATTADPASGGFSRQIPRLPVTPAFGHYNARSIIMIDFFNRPFKRKETSELRKRELGLEGTRIHLFTAEAAFFKECRKSGLAALVLPFSEFWPTVRRGFRSKAITGDFRLLCSSCVVDMPEPFRTSLPGFGSIVDVKGAMCGYCGSKNGILLFDDPKSSEITEQDMLALLELWRFRCQQWWTTNEQDDVICDVYDCSSRILRPEGYHLGDEIYCEKCASRATDSEGLIELRKNQNYFGISELRRARSFKFLGWRLERGSIIESIG